MRPWQSRAARTPRSQKRRSRPGAGRRSVVRVRPCGEDLNRPARPAERRSCRRCPRCPGRRPLRQARGTYRSGSRPRLPRWARRAGRRHSYGTTPCTRRGAHPGDRPGHTRCWCQRRSRSQQATGRSPPRAAHRLARTRRSSRCHRSRRTPARGEIPGGLEARRRVAQAARERAKTAPRRGRRQAAATAPWLSHVQFTRVGRISLKPTRRRLGAPETGGPRRSGSG